MGLGGESVRPGACRRGVEREVGREGVVDNGIDHDGTMTDSSRSCLTSSAGGLALRTRGPVPLEAWASV